MTNVDGDLLLPEGTRLLHIGPHKTGTTSVQGAFHLARRAAEANGVRYAGPNRHPRQAAQAAAARSSAARRGVSMRAWRQLVGEVRRARDARVVISSEWFADASAADIRLLVRDLDASRLHVVVTLRPLSSILASQWQQYVQAGMTTAYVDWLRSVFDAPTSVAAERFWQRHRHDRLIERWAAVVGRNRVTAVVADDRDHEAVLRVFERLVGLDRGTLVLAPDRTNRSLTRAEVELIRAMNGAFPRVGIDGARRLDLVLFGAAANLRRRQPAPGEPRIETPAWALERANEVAREIVAGIAGSGVRVVGDLESLAGATAASITRTRSRTKGTRTIEETPTADVTWSAITGEGAMGVLIALGLAREGGKAGPEIDVFSSARLRSVLIGRLRDAAATGMRALRPAAAAGDPG